MVHCAVFGCNASNSTNRVALSSSKFPTQPTLLKKRLAKIKPSNFKPTKHKLFRPQPGEDGSPGLSWC